MSYPHFAVNGDLNLCYLFMQELEGCFRNKMYPHTFCQNQIDDFLECHSRQKHVHSYNNIESSHEDGLLSNGKRK